MRPMKISIFIIVSFIFLSLPPSLNAGIQVTFSDRDNSVILISFEKNLDAKTISVKNLKIVERFVKGVHLVEENLPVDEIEVDKDRIELRLAAEPAGTGIVQVSYEPGLWSCYNGSSVKAFALPIQNRNDLIEDWEPVIYRRWVGPNLWANRLQDWEIVNGRLECGVRIDDFPMPMRTVHAITQEVIPGSGEEFHLAVEVQGRLSQLQSAQSRAGFLIGAGNGWLDYRAAAIVQSYSGLGGGVLCLADYAADRFTFRDNCDEKGVDLYPVVSGVENIEGKKSISSSSGNILLELSVEKGREGDFTLTLAGWERETGVFLGGAILQNRDRKDVSGSFAIMAHPGKTGFDEPLKFSDFRAWGSMLKYHPEREFGPIAGTLYSLNKREMKMTVQFMPLAPPGKYLDRFPKPLLAAFEYRIKGASAWQAGGKARITQPEYMAHFKVENWDDSQDNEYRIVFNDRFAKTHYYSGVIRKDPHEREEVSFIALTGMGVMGRRADSHTPGEDTRKINARLSGRWTPANVWFPHAEIVANIKQQDPDILFFTGDQVYENNPTKPDRRDRFPVLDYLYKWYLWHWAFRELTSERPAILQIDDHDVYAGNVWGYGGKLNLTGLNSDGGGYMVDPLFVRMVERTQCRHNPDPYRYTEPLKNGFSSYFGSLTYGGISFAILEDRKFKTPPPRDTFTPEDDILLGKQQLQFLEEWSHDWSDADLKVIVSQSTYASTHTDWGDDGLKDYDTGGYPKAGRDRALEAFRRTGAFIVCGDQHLATITRMGIAKPGDAALQFCVPAAGNIYWRWFFPEKFIKIWEKTGKTEIPDVSGDYMDEFGNHFQVIAVANPQDPNVIPLGRTKAWIPQSDDLIQKRVSQGDGYGRVIVKKSKRTITFECYPFDAEFEKGKEAQFKGWPYTISFDELDRRVPSGYLPELRFKGIVNPVVKVIDEKDGATVWVRRVSGKVYSPPVYKKGSYRICIFDPENPERQKILKGLRPTGKPGDKRIRIKF